MRDAVIVEAVRTPVGRRNGILSGVHPVDLGSTARGADPLGERFMTRYAVAPDGTVITSDEGIRRGGTLATLAALRPAFRPDGVIAAGNSSQISDGSAALLMTTLVHHMRDTGIRYVLQTMREGGGQANATILELL